ELPNKAWALRDFDAAAKFISMADAYGNALGGNYDVFREALALYHTWIATAKGSVNHRQLAERAMMLTARAYKFTAEHGALFVKQHLQTELTRRAQAGLLTQRVGESDKEF